MQPGLGFMRRPFFAASILRRGHPPAPVAGRVRVLVRRPVVECPKEGAYCLWSIEMPSATTPMASRLVDDRTLTGPMALVTTTATPMARAMAARTNLRKLLGFMLHSPVEAPAARRF